MANPEHVAVVRQGKDAIAKWRKGHPGERLDLSSADLGGIDLSNANLAHANLAQAILAHANLAHANLSMANLTYADLFGADLSGADLSKADLAFASLISANMNGAKLRGAELGVADLSLADLTGSDLSDANLFVTKLYWTRLLGANLSDAIFNETCILYVDLNGTAGLATARHDAPSSVSVDTLITTLRTAAGELTADVRAFLLNAGVPHELLAALPAIVAKVKYYSCFISYGQPDLKFAQSLTEELKTRGVSCWLYDLDATVGRRTWSEIIEKRREADKMVVLCSAGALIRQGVLKEIEEQIDENPEKIVPISLDDVWKEPGFKVVRGNRDLKPFLLDKNYADFANQPYDEALERLLPGLRRTTKGRGKKGRGKKG